MRRRTKIRGIKTLWITVLTFLILSVGIMNADAQLETGMTIEPWLTSAEVGSTFIVDIMVHNVVDCFAWQVNITWNLAVLNISSIYDPYYNYWFPQFSYGDFMADQPHNDVNKIDYDEGWFMIGQTTQGEVFGVTGSGWLAAVEFKVVGAGNSVIDIASNYWYSGGDPPYPTTYMLDYIGGGVEIPMTPQNGYFVIVPTPWDTDLNQDGLIDIRDLARVAIKYGWEGTAGEIPEDITGPLDEPDGHVDIYDLSAVAMDYGIRYYP